MRMTPYLPIHLQRPYTFSRLAIQTSFFCHCKYLTARLISDCMPKQTRYVTVQHVCVCVSASNQPTTSLATPKSTLILSSHPCLGLLNGLLSRGFPKVIFLLIRSVVLTCCIPTATHIPPNARPSFHRCNDIR
jgi:hypothetical protein